MEDVIKISTDVPSWLKLLIDLLFYSGPSGHRRLWLALLDRPAMKVKKSNNFVLAAPSAPSAPLSPRQILLYAVTLHPLAGCKFWLLVHPDPTG